ncbi:MAG: hypothetical protein Kow0079_04460 [Vicingaceae bacterium]
MKTLFITATLFLGAISLNAQSLNQAPVNTDNQAKLVKTKRIQPELARSKSTAERPVDEYMGKKDKILSVLTVATIPSDLPKYAVGMNRKEYRKQVITYLKNHKDIVKKEYHEKLDTL